MLFYNQSTQLELETLHKEETCQDLQNPMDSEVLNLLPDGRFLGKICEPYDFIAHLVPP